MMEKSMFRERLSHVEESVHHAVDACMHAGSVPGDVKESIAEMERRTSQIRESLPTLDQWHMLDSIGKLERISEHVRDTCHDTQSLDPELRDAVTHAYEELSHLKRQMH